MRFCMKIVLVSLSFHFHCSNIGFFFIFHFLYTKWYERFVCNSNNNIQRRWWEFYIVVELLKTKQKKKIQIHPFIGGMVKFTCGLSNRSIDGRLEYSSFIIEPGPPFPLPPSIGHDCCDSAECGGGESSIQWHWLSWHWAWEMEIDKKKRQRRYPENEWKFDCDIGQRFQYTHTHTDTGTFFSIQNSICDLTPK